MPRMLVKIKNVINGKGIQTKLLRSYIFIVLIPLATVGVLSYILSSKAVYEEVSKNNEQLVQEMGRNIDTYLKRLDESSKIYVSRALSNSINSMESLNRRRLDLNDSDVLANLMYMNEYINTTYGSSEDFMSIRFFSDQGEFLSTSFDVNTYKLYAYNSSEEEQWRKTMMKNLSDRLIFDVHPIEKEGEYTFTASRAAINPYTQMRYGYISYDMSFDSFAGIFRQFENRSGSTVQVVKSDGTLLYHTDRNRIGKAGDPDIVTLLQDPTKDHPIKVVDGEEVVITHEWTSSGELAVIGFTELELMMGKVNFLRNVIWVIFFVSLGLAVLISMGVSMYIAMPIKKLNSLMSRVEEGNFNVVASYRIESQDEIGRLSRSFNSMVSTIRQLIRSRYEVELRKKDAELKALLMQINPHFLYNTLEVIGGMADSEGVDKISDMTQSLSKIFRYNIDLKADKVLLKDELTNCNHFFYILKCRFEDNLVVEQDIDPEAGHYFIVKQVLQPLVENAIKHGVEKKIGKGTIRLSVQKQDEYIHIIIEDNGVGFSDKKLVEFEQYVKQLTTTFYDSSSSIGLGLKNVYGRLRIVYGDKLDFRIDSTLGEGTRICITIPAVKDFHTL